MMRWAGILVFSFLLFVPADGRGAELIMFESQACEWCEMWDEEVGVIYHKTDEAPRAPLRRISIHDPLRPEFKNLKPVIYTPTFVLVEGGREIGRITGYPGEAHFWSLLGDLIGKLDAGIPGCKHNTQMTDRGTTPMKETPLC